MKPKVLVIVGPTASGKSALAVSIAQKYNGEVISADSRQVYKDLNIGTAKITKEEMQGVPHHLIDVADIHTVYNASDFKRDATEAILDITQRGKLPIIAGGTFFYVDTLLGKIQAPEVSPNPALREKLEALDTHALYESLLKLDPRRAADIDKDNKRRLIRALEVVEALGAVPEQSSTELPYDVLMLGIETDKKDLRARIKARAPEWLSNGFKQEIQALLQSGISKERLAEIGFEYQIGVELLEGALTEDAFLEVFEQKNWQYAKRQLTWLKRDSSIHWLSLSEETERDLLITQFLRTM